MRRASLLSFLVLATFPALASAAPAASDAGTAAPASTPASAAPAATASSAAPSTSASTATATAAPAVASAPATKTAPEHTPTVDSDVTPPTVTAPAHTKGYVPRDHTLKIANFPHSREGKPLRWDPEWRRFEVGDAILTGADGVIALAAQIVPPLKTHWTGGILFDESARNALRLGSIDARGWAGDTSDVLLSMQVMAPFLIDSLATAWWYRGSADVAQQMAMIDLETLSVTAALQGLSVTLTGRERPYVRTCGKGTPADSLDCQTNGEYRSFFSGHTSLSFTSAALACSHHLNLDLFENGPADELTCASAMGVAATTGVLRIMADYHYASDVITGMIVGNAVGFGVPYFFHYRRSKKNILKTGDVAPSTERSDFNFHVVPMGLGAAAVGTF